MENIKYLVIANIAAADEWISEVDMEKIWCNKNPGGWTYQDMTGPHGTVLDTFDTEPEAKKYLADYRKQFED